jgi:hypothetical protein
MEMAEVVFLTLPAIFYSLFRNETSVPMIMKMTTVDDLNRLKSLIIKVMLDNNDNDLRLLTGRVHGSGFHGCGPYPISAMYRGNHSWESGRKDLVPAVDLPKPYRLGHKHLQEYQGPLSDRVWMNVVDVNSGDPTPTALDAVLWAISHNDNQTRALREFTVCVVRSFDHSGAQSLITPGYSTFYGVRRPITIEAVFVFRCGVTSFFSEPTASFSKIRDNYDMSSKIDKTWKVSDLLETSSTAVIGV